MFSQALCTDPEIIGRIYLQYCSLSIDGYFSDDFKDDFFPHLFSLMMKLSATRYHLNNYITLEQSQYLEAQKELAENTFKTREAFELIHETEAFLFQTKSSLDILCKLLIPCIGKHSASFHTFGNKGEDLIKALKRYRKKGSPKIQAVDDLTELIRTDKEQWLKKVIDLRDTFSHYKALGNYYFKPIKQADNSILIEKPKLLNMETVVLLRQIFQNNLEFCQDFITCSINIVLPPAINPHPIPESIAIEKYGEHGKFVKYGLFF